MEDEDPAIIHLGEVCIEAGPKKLRKLAKAFKCWAKALERGTEQDHFHFNGNVDTRPQIVLINPEMAKRWRAEHDG